jgi:hypothetical protein
MSKTGALGRRRAVEINCPDLHAKVMAGEMGIAMAYAMFRQRKAAGAKAQHLATAADGALSAAMQAARQLDRADLVKLRAYIISILPAAAD